MFGADYQTDEDLDIIPEKTNNNNTAGNE